MTSTRFFLSIRGFTPAEVLALRLRTTGSQVTVPAVSPSERTVVRSGGIPEDLAGRSDGLIPGEECLSRASAGTVDQEVR